jgi:hypothetical protein
LEVRVTRSIESRYAGELESNKDSGLENQ